MDGTWELAPEKGFEVGVVRHGPFVLIFVCFRFVAVDFASFGKWPGVLICLACPLLPVQTTWRSRALVPQVAYLLFSHIFTYRHIVPHLLLCLRTTRSRSQLLMKTI
eukprot:4558878-Pyramimonas_sp.AAC.1